MMQKIVAAKFDYCNHKFCKYGVWKKLLENITTISCM